MQDQRILETLKERLNALEENLNMEVERFLMHSRLSMSARIRKL